MQFLMRVPRIPLTMLALAALMLLAANSFAQYSNAEEAKEFINDRLSHSLLQKIDPDGLVTVNAPGKKIKFRLQEVSFNYNGGNDDDRVRVFCDECIENYEHQSLTEKTSRQSFVCESEKEANEVIKAFRYLKKLYPGGQKGVNQGDKKLRVADSTLGTKTVGEAIDFINENLSYSMITGIDEKGLMTISAPDDIYLVNLRLAEFGFNDVSDGTKVRIYGDYATAVKKKNDQQKFISRQSFQTPGRVNAFKAIPVLYYLKSTYSDLDPGKIPGFKNVTDAKTDNYKNVIEAIEYINDRLQYSIILGIDPTGNITINAPEEIYRFNIHEAKADYAKNHERRSDWVPFIYTDGPLTGIIFECKNCIKKYESPDSYEKLNDQVFQCRNKSDVTEVLKALTYIKASLKVK
ncbi:MAG: hypothetical protein WCK09_11950 [Bacteroidota bacterium]